MFKYFFIIIFFLISEIQSSYSEILKKFEVTGNDRVSKQTIINFTDSDINQNIFDKDLDLILKKLYETTFFEDVSINLTEGILKITVKEYPIIQQIIINGIKSESQIETLKDEIYLKEKNPYNKTFVKQDLQKMLTILKSSGFYFAKIEVNEQVNSNNTVNIIYDIERGDKALIK